MHALIFAPTHNTAEEIQAALGDAAGRYTVVVTWANALSCLKENPPELIIIERTALTRANPTVLLNLAESGRWPPVILVDTPATGDRNGISLVKRLTQAAPPFFQIGELCIDTRKKRAGLDKHWVTLPPLQFHLLLTLAERAGEVVGYRELLRAVWGYDGSDQEARELIKVHIRQIRRRLGLDPEEHHYIHSVRGFGYMLAPPGED